MFWTLKIYNSNLPHNLIVIKIHKVKKIYTVKISSQRVQVCKKENKHHKNTPGTICTQTSTRTRVMSAPERTKSSKITLDFKNTHTVL